MALTLLKTQADAGTIEAADWNAEFNNIYNNGIGLISPLTANLNLGSFDLVETAGGVIGLWRLIQTQTASSSTSIDFTSGIDSGHDLYMLVLTEVLMATDAQNIHMRVSQASSFKTDAKYNYAAIPIDSDSTTVTGTRNTDAAQMVLNGNTFSNVSTEVIGGIVYFAIRPRFNIAEFEKHPVLPSCFVYVCMNILACINYCHSHFPS